MRLKGKRAVFRQILPGAPLEAQICHLEPRPGHFEAKICHFEAKSDRFEAKMVIWTVWKGKFSKMKAVFFFDKFFMRLKGKRAVFCQFLPGAPLEAQICHLEPRMGHFEAHKTDHFEPKSTILKPKPTIFKRKPIILKLKPAISKAKPIILKLHVGASLKHTTRWEF